MTVFSTLLSFLHFHVAVFHLSFFVLLSLLVFLLIMSTSQSMSLAYHQLTNTIGNHGSVEEFYNVFILVDTDYAHFSFTDMQEICFIDGMDRWPKLINPKDLIQCTFLLVSFLPSAKEHYSSLFEKVEDLFFSLFVSQEDHDAVQTAMANMPTMALFMSKSSKDDDTQSR